MRLADGASTRTVEVDADRSESDPSALSFVLGEPAVPRQERADVEPRRRLTLARLGALSLVLIAVAGAARLGANAPSTWSLAVGALASLVTAGLWWRAQPGASRPRMEAAGRGVEAANQAAAGDPERRALEIGARELRLRRGDTTLLTMSLDEELGVMLLSNRRRDRIAAAVTSPTQTLIVAARLDPRDPTRERLLSRCTVLSDDESALDAVGPDGQAVTLGIDAFAAWLGAVERLAPSSAGRLVLSDQRGERVVLDEQQLGTRLGRVDLTRPLEWRPILFQEAFGQAVSLYQGTWVRQGGVELVLVSLLTPSFLEMSGRRSEPPRPSQPPPSELDRLAVRDQRLLRAGPADPPPSEQRIAIDGVFVVPLRAALDQAPRASSRRAAAKHA